MLCFNFFVVRIKEKDPPCAGGAASLVLEAAREGQGFFPLVLGLLSMSTITGELD